jgi:hypothetical protein
MSSKLLSPDTVNSFINLLKEMFLSGMFISNSSAYLFYVIHVLLFHNLSPFYPFDTLLSWHSLCFAVVFIPTAIASVLSFFPYAYGTEFLYS